MPKPVTLNNPRLGVAESTKRYMAEGIRHVCENFKKRLPGTQSERDAQAFFKEELEKISDPSRGDAVLMEDFTLHPHAFMGFIILACSCLLGTVACFWLGKSSIVAAAVGAVLAVFALLVVLFEFLMYREFVDFLFPKRVSRNVYAVRKPTGETRRRIIFGGHTDVANEWTFTYMAERKGMAFALIGAGVGLAVCLAASVTRLAFVLQMRLREAAELTAGNVLMNDAYAIKGGWLAWGVALLCMVPLALVLMKFINYKIAVDGANDNLSANYVSMALLKEMNDSGFRFEHTEVCCLLTGAEEAGLRGAKAFAKKHLKELSEVDTVFIAMDTMREIEEMRVCNIGCTGTVRNDKAVGVLLHEAGRACGVEIPDGEVYPGAVDSEAFSMFGLRATGFTAVSHEAKRYYHTRHDTADNIDMDCIALSLNICKEAARIFDQKGAN